MKSVYDYLTEKRLTSNSIGKKPEVGFGELRDMILEGKDIDEVDYSKVTSFQQMFFNQGHLIRLPDNLDLSHVTNMCCAFRACSELEYIPKNLDTSKVEDMRGMFYNCTSLKSIPAMDTTNCYKMQLIFDGCDALEHIERPSDWYLYNWDGELAPKNPILKEKYPELYDESIRK